MTSFIKTLTSIGHFLKNKAVSILFLLGTMYIYKNLPENNALPFPEVLYAVILILAISVISPIMRLLVFPEVASYAESGQMEKDLDAGVTTPWITHYRIATIICYVTSLYCVSALLNH